MVLHGEKTFKTTLQKNFSKSPKSVVEYLWWSFVIVEPFKIRLTVILLTILKLMILWNFNLKLHIQSPVEHLRWSFFADIVNMLTWLFSQEGKNPYNLQ